MKAIVAVDASWGIGCNNRLLAHVPEDMKFFKETTTGHTIVMGRKTFESFPGKGPLPKRRNIVLSKSMDEDTHEGLEVLAGIEELSDLLSADEEVFVIGGESVYKALLPACDTVYVTKLHERFEADTFFPNLDLDDNWVCAYESEIQSSAACDFHFCRYERSVQEPKD